MRVRTERRGAAARRPRLTRVLFSAASRAHVRRGDGGSAGGSLPGLQERRAEEAPPQVRGGEAAVSLPVWGRKCVLFWRRLPVNSVSVAL